MAVMLLRNPVWRLGALALVCSMALLVGAAQAAVPRSGVWRAVAVDATGQRSLFKFTVARSERFASGKSVFFKQPNGFRLPIARPDVLDENCQIATGVFGPTEAHIGKRGTLKAPFDRSGSWVGDATIKGRFITPAKARRDLHVHLQRSGEILPGRDTALVSGAEAQLLVRL